MSTAPQAGSRIGYARVSTLDQDPTLQLDALDTACCIRIFTEHASGATRDRPQLTAALEYLRSGDTLVVWRLDRLGRSLSHLVATMGDLNARGVELISLTEAIDTNTATGRLVFHMAGAFAQFERDLIAERTRAGLASAAQRGRHPGRPTVMTPTKIAAAKVMLEAGQSQRAIAEVLGVSHTSLGRAMKLSQGG